MPIAKSQWIWMNGKLVPWDQATIHVMSHVVNYGSNVFEGIRCYDNNRVGPAVFCLDAHLTRLYRSAGVYRMEIAYSKEEFKRAIQENPSLLSPYHQLRRLALQENKEDEAELYLKKADQLRKSPLTELVDIKYRQMVRKCV